MFSDNNGNSPVTFFKLFCFASKIDILLIAMSVTASVIHGLYVPSFVILFGNLAKVLIEANNKRENWNNDYANIIVNSSTSCQNSSSFEISAPQK